MKIQGRFIVILAVLGLLVALVPLASSAGAVAGKVTLGGGEKGQYFSDRSGKNIVTITVEDADLTPGRVGQARSRVGAGTAVDLRGYYVIGEKEKTDKFDGGENNPLCNHDVATDADGTSTPNVRYQAGSPDSERFIDDTDRTSGQAPAACLSKGDLMFTDDVVTLYTGTVGTNAAEDLVPSAATDNDVYSLNLSKTARDRHVESSTAETDVALINEKDIISVVVNGSEVDGATRVEADNTVTPNQTGARYEVTVLTPCATPTSCAAGETQGGGINTVRLHETDPQNAADSISVTYKYSEFNFLDTGDATPVRRTESSVRFDNNTDAAARRFFGSSGSVGIGSAVGSILNLTTTGANFGGHVVVRFVYDVKDEEKDFVTLNSASVPSKKLLGVETLPDSNKFEAKVAIFSRADHALIRDAAGTISTVAGQPSNDGDGDGKIQIGELNTTYQLNNPATQTGDTELYTRVTTAADSLGLELTADASDLLDKIISGEDGDVLSATYTDLNPSTVVSKSATVDMAAPVVTLISPSDNFFTSTGAVTLSAEVTDSGAGVTQDKILITVRSTGVPVGANVHSPIEGGYRVTVASTGTISEGTKDWYVGVEDKVGNVPTAEDPETDVKEAPKGAIPHGTTPAAMTFNAFKFTVDTRAPSLLSARTGLNLKNPGVTTAGDNQEDEKTNNRQWVRALFDLGTGGAPLDPTSVSANDFRVDGAIPLDYKINAVSHDTDGVSEAKKGAAVYLQVGQLDTDAKPKVELTGEIKDKAGNTRSDGTVAAAADGLSPVLTVTPSAEVAETEVTVTVTTSERLRSNPTVGVTTTKPVKGTTPVTDALTVSLQTGSLTTWTATLKKTGDANRYYVVAEARDQNDNEAKVGVAAKDGDLVSFQLDDKNPSLKFKDAAGKDLEDSKQEEGAVWLVAEFDEDEHLDDKSRGVTVTAVTLTNTESEEVVTDDVAMVFGGEVNCADHAHTGEGDAPTDKCAQRTLAVNLAPGMYNIDITGVDATGNETSDDVDFQVVEAKPFEIKLFPGQNFISIPGMPQGEGGNIDTLLADEAITSVSTYDRAMELAGENPWLRSSKDLETGMFSGDITAIEPGKAYFVNSTASVTLKVKLQTVGDLPPVIPVRQGYNAIGFWDVADEGMAEIDQYLGSIGWSVAYAYDPTPGKGWTVLRKGGFDENDEPLMIEAGKGYLVYALYDAVLTP